jgi:hypothetical protein
VAIRTHTNNSDNPQGSLFIEDFNEALSGIVAALGGAKVVGSKFFTDLSPEAAGRRVLDALNPDRTQIFSPTQVFTLFKWAREKGYHVAMEYFADGCGYSRPTPIAPEDARAELQRQFIDAIDRAEKIGKRLQR